MHNVWMRKMTGHLQTIREKVLIQNELNRLDHEFTEKMVSLLSRVRQLLHYIENLPDTEAEQMIEKAVVIDIPNVLHFYADAVDEGSADHREALLQSLAYITGEINRLLNRSQERTAYHLNRRVEAMIETYKRMENREGEKYGKEKEKKIPMNEEEIYSIHNQVEQLVNEITEADQEDAERIIVQLGTIGETAQREASRTIEVLKSPVKKMVDNKSAEISDTLVKLRNYVNELQPDKNILLRIFMKVMRKRGVELYLRKYNKVEKQMRKICESLVSGRERLLEDNTELRYMKNVAAEKIGELEKRVYFGRKLLMVLEEKIQNGSLHKNKDTVQKGMQKLIARTTNMMQMENLLHQSIVSVDVLIENNEKVNETIFTALTMVENVVTVSTTIHLALYNQDRVMKTVESISKDIEEWMGNNAATLKTNTDTASRLFEKPIVSMEKVQQACGDLFDAIRISEESAGRMIASGKKYIQFLEKLNMEMERKTSSSPISEEPMRVNEYFS